MSGRFKNLIFVFFGLVVLLLVAEGVYYYFTIYRKPPELPPEKPPVEVERKWLPISPIPSEAAPKNNLEIADKVLAWLEGQMNERGFYNFGIRCKLDRRCEEPESDGRSGLGVLWAYFNHYQQTREAKDIPKIDYLLDLYADKEKIDNIQNIFWNCKWMYEMWQADFFSSAQKEKVETICDRGSYYPPLVEEAKKLMERGEEIDLKKVVSKRKGPAGLINQRIPEEKNENLIRASVYSSDFTAKYLWHGNEADLKEAQGYFYHAVNLWSQEPEDKYLEGKCLLGIAALDLYKVAREQKYLDFTQALVEKEKIKEICLKESGDVSSDFCHHSLLEKATCAEFTNDLYDITREERYKNLKTGLRDSLIDNNFDFPGYSGHVNGVGAFYSIHFLRDVKTLYYFIRENGLIVALLMGK